MKIGAFIVGVCTVIGTLCALLALPEVRGYFGLDSGSDIATDPPHEASVPRIRFDGVYLYRSPKPRMSYEVFLFHPDGHLEYDHAGYGVIDPVRHVTSRTGWAGDGEYLVHDGQIQITVSCRQLREPPFSIIYSGTTEKDGATLSLSKDTPIDMGKNEYYHGHRDFEFLKLSIPSPDTESTLSAKRNSTHEPKPRPTPTYSGRDF
jgi:hypothetical protein